MAWTFQSWACTTFVSALPSVRQSRPFAPFAHTSLVPQDPVLFSGTVRSNLDPFQQYTNDQIWQALDQVHLRTQVMAADGGLESIIVEGACSRGLAARSLLLLLTSRRVHRRRELVARPAPALLLCARAPQARPHPRHG